MKINKRYRNGLWAVFLIVLTAFVTSYFNGCFSKKGASEQSVTANDSGTAIGIKNENSPVKGDQITAGKDVTQTKVEVKKGGNAFFDSSTQVNNYNNTVEQRKLDLGLMKRIIDSIPSKETIIEIGAAGGMEGENLGRMMKNYLVDKGYKNTVVIPSSLTGNYEIIEFEYYNAAQRFIITIHPRANVPQIQ